MKSKMNGWPLLVTKGVKCKDVHPPGETYICPYEPDGDGALPCSTHITLPCYFNPRHLPRKEANHAT